MHVVAIVVQYAALVVIGFTLLYVFSLTAVGLRLFHRSGTSMRGQEALVSGPAADTTEYAIYYLIPCLNEEAVIGTTIDTLFAGQGHGQVVVIDDASDDDTVAIAQSRGHRVHVVRRVLPAARLGKGKALNAGIRVVRDDVAALGIDSRRVIVCVLDADGQLTPGASAAAASLFDDPAVGGAQLVVRIRNRERLVTRFQDMEFWAMSGVGQIGRIATGTVSLGGNGQFTRLYALDELGETPWSESLTEDLDLGISLAVRGWRTSSTTGGYVTQQAVTELSRLIRQRTRWYQGHMLTGRRIGELLRSPYLGNVQFFELAAYLAVPWFITLPWSIIQQYVVVQIALGNGLPNHVFADTSITGRISYALIWYLVSFAPHLFWGFLYWRRAEETTIRRAMLMSHLMIPWSYVAYLSAWRALGRILVGRKSWTKTARIVETPKAVTT
jgi:1,2-diacylglycerol 3-beta-glucosyltransferase